MRGKKSEVYEGGIRSPLLAHWPSQLEAGHSSDRISAHVDLMPTILDACGVEIPAALDGRSLLPLLAGTETEWPDRALTIQAHRGNVPLRYHNFALRTQRWKLLNASGFHRELESLEPKFELYDMQSDPLELENLASKHPEIVARLRASYDQWFEDVGATDPTRYAPPLIALGAEAAPRVTLTRQDWRLIGEARDHGEWHVDVRHPGPYRMRVRFLAGQSVRRLRLRCGNTDEERVIADGAGEVTLDDVSLPVGEARLRFDLEDGERTFGPYQVTLERP